MDDGMSNTNIGYLRPVYQGSRVASADIGECREHPSMERRFARRYLSSNHTGGSMPGKTDEVAPVKTTELTPSNVDEKALYMGDAANGSDANSDAKAIVARIMNAETPEDIFGGPGNLLASADLVGKPFTLQDVEYRESDMGDGPGVYSLLHVIPWGTSNVVLATCGARNVMAAAFRGKQLGYLPRGPMTLVEGKQTKQGYTPLWLQDMDRATADTTAGVQEVPFE